MIEAVEIRREFSRTTKKSVVPIGRSVNVTSPFGGFGVTEVGRPRGTRWQRDSDARAAARRPPHSRTRLSTLFNHQHALPSLFDGELWRVIPNERVNLRPRAFIPPSRRNCHGYVRNIILFLAMNCILIYYQMTCELKTRCDINLSIHFEIFLKF